MITFRAMPDSDGVTAIAAWLIICTFFVFCALCVYAYLLWRLKPSILRKHLLRERANEVIETQEGAEPPADAASAGRRAATADEADKDDEEKSQRLLSATSTSSSTPKKGAMSGSTASEPVTPLVSTVTYCVCCSELQNNLLHTMFTGFPLAPRRRPRPDTLPSGIRRRPCRLLDRLPQPGAGQVRHLLSV